MAPIDPRRFRHSYKYGLEGTHVIKILEGVLMVILLLQAVTADHRLEE